MVSANKILTVSYGTFSCTLEGFDEPFSTMKAIAEYFRDLAADDRYFGAEPPTPDAEMLHRIAEHEIQRRVEAKVQTNGVVLRASDLSEAGQTSAVQTPAPLAPVAASQTGAQAAEPTRTAGNAAATTREQPVAPRTEPEDVIDDFAQDRVAAKLLRIRAAASQAETATPAAADTRAEDDAKAKAEAEAERADRAARAQSEAAARFEADARAEAERIEAERAEEEARLNAAQEAEEAARREEEARAAEQARQDASAVEADATNDDATEDDADQLLQARVLKISPAQKLDTAGEDEDAGGDLVGSAADDGPTADDTASSDAADVAPDTETPEAKTPQIETAETETATGTTGDDGDDRDFPDTQPEADAATVDDVAEDDDTFEDTASGTPAKSTEPTLDRVSRAVGETGLSPEDEADLFQELAEVESETDKPDAADDGRSLLANAAEPEEAAMSRLMKQAETELSGPENRRRLSAIEHLRAAVAATRAEQQDPQAQADDKADRALGQFQDDLADVVRPRRPVSGSGSRSAAKRPTAPADRIAPLILVSEQRIDKTDAPQRTIRPVRPRRFASGNLAIDEDADDDGYESAPAPNLMSTDASFPQFVARIGATDLPDLLEAAAVYCTQVEGRQSFSRPQILRKLTELPDGTDISREEGLRSFGRLLRDGRIAKVRRGQFAVKDGSPFLPEARRISEG